MFNVKNIWYIFTSWICDKMRVQRPNGQLWNYRFFIYTCILFQIQFNSLELKTQMNFSDRLLPLKFVCPFACLSVYYMKRCCNVFTNVFNVKEAKLHGEVWLAFTDNETNKNTICLMTLYKKWLIA